MRTLFFLWTFFLLVGCIPIKFAPHIKEDKILKARKFQRSSKNEYAFVFKDTKEADEFFQYIQARYSVDEEVAAQSIPFVLNKQVYQLSFSEVEKTTKTINLLPFLADAAIQNKHEDAEPVFDELYTSRMSYWYIVIYVVDMENKDCLHPKYPNRQEVIAYLQELRKSYVGTANYTETTLKNGF